MTERRNAASLFQHSLKTPLSSVKVAAQLLQKHLQGQLNEKDTQLLDTIIRNASTLELRINKILDYSTPWQDRIFVECELDQLEEIHALKFETPADAPVVENPVPLQEDKIVVHADPEIADLIPKFLENRKKDMDLILSALQKSDFETIRLLGHSMKGSGGGYGFNGVSDIGKIIEEGANERSEVKIQNGVAELGRYLSRVEVIYDEQ